MFPEGKTERLPEERGRQLIPALDQWLVILNYILINYGLLGGTEASYSAQLGSQKDQPTPSNRPFVRGTQASIVPKYKQTRRPLHQNEGYVGNYFSYFGGPGTLGGLIYVYTYIYVHIIHYLYTVSYILYR